VVHKPLLYFSSFNENGSFLVIQYNFGNQVELGHCWLDFIPVKVLNEEYIRMKTKAANLFNLGVLVLLVILAAAVVLRVAALQNQSLWYDELQSVTHASLPIDKLVLSVTEFDPHPPLYYMQLHYWLSLGSSDLWIKINATFWSILTLISLYYLGKKLFDTRTALLASMIFALNPFAIHYAGQARMYSWLMFLAIWSFYFTHRLLEDRSLGSAIGSAVFTTAFLYSQGGAFLLLVVLFTYAGLFAYGKGHKWSILKPFIIVQAVPIILYLPWLILRGQNVGAGHLVEPSLLDVLDTAFIIQFGLGSFPDSFTWLGRLLIILLMAGIIIASVRNNSVRVLAISFLLVPFLFVFGVSYAIRPFWHYRVFAFATPFLSMIIALTIIEIASLAQQRSLYKRAVLSGLVGAIIILLLAGLYLQQTTFSYRWDFYDAAQFIEANVEEGTIIYVPNERVYWGMSWYLIGPGSVDPLEIGLPLITNTENRIKPRKTIGRPKDNEDYWIVYRSGEEIVDRIKPFEQQQIENIDVFNKLFVARVK